MRRCFEVFVDCFVKFYIDKYKWEFVVLVKDGLFGLMSMVVLIEDGGGEEKVVCC